MHYQQTNQTIGLTGYEWKLYCAPSIEMLGIQITQAAAETQ